MEHVATLPIVQELVNLSKEGFIVFSLRDKQVVYSNPAAVALTGLMEKSSQKEVFSLLAQLESPERAHLENHFAELLEKSRAQVQVRMQSKDGREIYLSCRGYVMTDSNSVAIIVRDITEAYQHKEYLLKYTMKKNNLLDTLVHHISGALNLMQHLSAEATKHIGGDDQNLRAYLGLVQENSRHCLRVIEALNQEEYREAPHIVSRKNRLDVAKQVGHIADELKQSYISRPITFRSASDSIIVSTDEVKLLLIVNNLTSNAIKYSRESDPILLCVDEFESEVVIRIIDKGIGIPQALQKKIFQRQQGLGRVGLQGEQSFGLGLYISKTLADMLGAKIWFESEEGKGSSFSLSIPKE